MNRKYCLVVVTLLAILAFGASSVMAGPPIPPFPEPAEKHLQSVVFIRYAPGFQKEKPCDHDGICDPDEKGWCSDCKGGEEEPTTACYDFLAGSKPRWNWVEDYHYSEADLARTSTWATSKWESVTSADIFGDGYPGAGAWGVYDYTNSILYGDYPEEGVIAVARIWFRGKNIYEYDIEFDTDYFNGDGSIDLDTDLDTVALHEFGHGAGLGDLYDTFCIDEVMYGIYEREKTELESGDITGIQTLYGP